MSERSKRKTLGTVIRGLFDTTTESKPIALTNIDLIQTIQRAYETLKKNTKTNTILQNFGILIKSFSS